MTILKFDWSDRSIFEKTIPLSKSRSDLLLKLGLNPNEGIITAATEYVDKLPQIVK